MKFSTRACLLLSAIVFVANASFSLLHVCSAAESSTNLIRPASTNVPSIDPKLLEAAEKGDAAVQTTVGRFYLKSDAGTNRIKEALKWFRRAAEQGFAPAQMSLGQGLILTARDKTNIAEGLAWVRKAADQNEVFALYLIGRAYEEGWRVVETNFTEAALWHGKAAAYGNAFSQFHLGRIRAEGRAGPADPVEALKWFELVNKNRALYSNQIALLTACNNSRADVVATMNAEQISEAVRRAAAFVPDTSFTNDYRIQFWSAYPYVRPLATTNTLSRPLPANGTPNRFTSLPPAQMTVEVPVRIKQFRPYVEVRVNGSKPLELLFDSGAGFSVISEKAAKKLKLKPSTNVMVGDRPLNVVEGTTLQIGGASFSPKRLYLHTFESTKMLDPFLDGILGADLLQHFAVELDYRKGRMKLMDLYRYKYTGPGDYLLMKMAYGAPCISAKILDGANRLVDVSLLVDTGATGFLYLEKEFSEKEKLQDSLGRTLSGSTIGFHGKNATQEGKMNGLQIGHYYFDTPPVRFFDESQGRKNISGLLGGAILSRFNVIFHYGRQQLILIPNNLFPQPTLRPDSASELFK